MSKTIIIDGEMSTDIGERKLVFVTTQSRAAALSAKVVELLGDKTQDLVYYNTKTGNKNYINFVQDHTVYPDPAAVRAKQSPQSIIEENTEHDPLTPSAASQIVEI